MDVTGQLKKVPWWAWVVGGWAAYKMGKGMVKTAAMGALAYGAYRTYQAEPWKQLTGRKA